MNTMAEDNARDMKRLRLARSAASAIREAVMAEVPWPKDVEALVAAQIKLEERAEHIEAVWN